MFRLNALVTARCACTNVKNTSWKELETNKLYRYSRVKYSFGVTTKNSVEHMERRPVFTVGSHTRGKRGLSFDSKTEFGETRDLLLWMVSPPSIVGIFLSSNAGML